MLKRMLKMFARSWPIGSLALLGLVVGLAVQTLEAEDRTQARVITRDGSVAEAMPSVKHVPVDRNRPEGPQIVQRKVVAPAAVVSRALSEQPVLPHLVEVQFGGVTVLVDPQVDYRRTTGGLDENHTIRRSQRLHHVSQPGLPARVLRHPQPETTPRPVRHEPAPDAIFLRPELLPSPRDEDDLIVQGE